MNVAAHQKKEKNEKTGKKEAEERKQATDFTETAYCPSAVIQRAARRKNGLCTSVRGTGTFEKANSHFDPTQTVSGTAPPR